MAVREATKRLVWARAAGTCSFPDCNKHLVVDAVVREPTALVGDVAHIVGHSEENGPRADATVPGGDRDGEENLILLCTEHHRLVDRQPTQYTVERLLGMKEAHLDWVRERLTKGRPTPAPARIAEVVHSTMLAVDQLPRFVYTAPCNLFERQVVKRVRYPMNREVLLPFVVREQKLIAFADLTEPQGPFHEAVAEHGAAERHEVTDWLKDEELTHWLITLFNRAVGKYAALLELRFDKDHRRYYFEPQRDAQGTAITREVTYRPMNQDLSKRQVAWNPVRKKTGEPKRHWIHLAASLRLLRVSPSHWVLAIRPEHRFTLDGYAPLSPKGTGKRSTSTKSRMYNNELLNIVQFWRSFLTKGQPRMILDLAGQSMIIDGQLLATDANWPGVSDDIIPFGNASVTDDLFTMSAYVDALAVTHPDAELNELELDDLEVLEEAVANEDDTLSDDDFESVEGRDDPRAGGE